jgi:hypothetical protein
MTQNANISISVLLGTHSTATHLLDTHSVLPIYYILRKILACPFIRVCLFINFVEQFQPTCLLEPTCLLQRQE